MFGDTDQGISRWGQALIGAQVVIAFVALALTIFAPREGEPVLLYPLTSTAASTLPATLSNPDTLLLARGQYAGSFVVRGDRPGFLASLAGDGVLVLNATAPGCGPRNPRPAP